MTQQSPLCNPQATSLQLSTSASRLDGVPFSLERSVRFASARLVYAAGILLRLHPEVYARGIVLLERFWSGGNSVLEFDPRDVAAAALYLAAKTSDLAIAPRRLVVVFAYVCELSTQSLTDDADDADDDDDDDKGKLEMRAHLSAAEYEEARARLYAAETELLRCLGFDTHVALPYALCINYLQALDLLTPSPSSSSPSSGKAVARAAFALLNAGLLSPQMLYLTHQPSALATAAVYLAARECAVPLPDVEWWEVFDVDREELGFLVLALKSVRGFAEQEMAVWRDRKPPTTVLAVREEIARRRSLDPETP